MQERGQERVAWGAGRSCSQGGGAGGGAELRGESGPSSSETGVPVGVLCPPSVERKGQAQVAHEA